MRRSPAPGPREHSFEVPALKKSSGSAPSRAPRARVRESISLTGQFAAVDEILSGRENLVLIAKLRHMKVPGQVADYLLARFNHRGRIIANGTLAEPLRESGLPAQGQSALTKVLVPRLRQALRIH